MLDVKVNGLNSRVMQARSCKYGVMQNHVTHASTNLATCEGRNGNEADVSEEVLLHCS